MGRGPRSRAKNRPVTAVGWCFGVAATGVLVAHAVGEDSPGPWLAVAWLAPAKDFAVLVACNQAHDKACNDAVLALIADHFKGERR